MRFSMTSGRTCWLCSWRLPPYRPAFWGPLVEDAEPEKRLADRTRRSSGRRGRALVVRALARVPALSSAPADGPHGRLSRAGAHPVDRRNSHDFRPIARGCLESPHSRGMAGRHFVLLFGLSPAYVVQGMERAGGRRRGLFLRRELRPGPVRSRGNRGAAIPAFAGFLPAPVRKRSHHRIFRRVGHSTREKRVRSELFGRSLAYRRPTPEDYLPG